MEQLIWKVGGAQGEGIDSTGDIFASALNRQGYYLFGYRHFMSLIKGGHTNYKIRIASQPVNYHGDGLDVLVAFDKRSIEENAFEFSEDCAVLFDSTEMEPLHPKGRKIQLFPVPMTQFAKEVGNVIMKNMVACGASAAAVGLPLEALESVVRDRFRKKGEEVIAKNSEAMRKGFDYFREKFGQVKKLPARVKEKGNYFITGNEMTALGALVAGCRFYAAYPISPSTEVMYWLVNQLPKYGGRIIQAEDEIAACIMAIAANYAGSRAMTATSGPGFSLMMEAVGLSGITETPLVIVDVMRGGPGTGLPTKMEQSDINEMIYGSHGEIPRVVLAPSSIEEIFLMMGAAFNLAEELQCPVFVATDLLLGISKMSVDDLDFNRIGIERLSLISNEQLESMEKGAYKRYQLDMPDGISPRSIPGQPNGIHVITSNEHDENRYEIEDPVLRVRMMKKRFDKLNRINPENLGGSGVAATEYTGALGGNQIVIVGFGSTNAQISEAVRELQEEGEGVGHLHIKLLHPFPEEQVRQAIGNAKEILIVENNATGQLAGLVRQFAGGHERIRQLNKFDGNPFRVHEITGAVRDLKAGTFTGELNTNYTVEWVTQETQEVTV